MKKRYSWALIAVMFMLPAPLFASDLSAEMAESPQRLFELDVGVGILDIRGKATIHISDSWTLEAGGHVTIGAAAYSAALGYNYDLYNSRGSDGTGTIVELTPALGWVKAFSIMGEERAPGDTRRNDNSITGLLAQASLGVHYYWLSHFGWHARLSGGLWASPEEYRGSGNWFRPDVALTTGPSF